MTERLFPVFSFVRAAHCQQMKVHAPVIVIKSFHKLGQGMVFQPAAGIVVPQVFLKRYRIIPGNTEEKRFRILKNGIDQAAD